MIARVIDGVVYVREVDCQKNMDDLIAALEQFVSQAERGVNFFDVPGGTIHKARAVLAKAKGL